MRSAHDCAEGGLAIALAEACISGQKGAEIALDAANLSASARWDQILFGEGGARILVSVAPDQAEAWESYLQDHLSDRWQKLGQVGDQSTAFRVVITPNLPVIDVSIADMSDRWQNAIERRLAV